MKTFLKITVIIMLLSTFSSCEKSSSNSGMACNETGNTLIFGRFCGMCITNCAVMYSLNDGCLQKDASHNYIISTGINFNGANMTQVQFDSVKGLNNKIPSQLVSSPSMTFGQPDAYDQCGYYLETNVNGIKKVWLVDTDTAFQPDYLKPFIVEVSQSINLLQ